MERLTKYDSLAGVRIGDLKIGVDERKAFDRLAAYEDTGLEPEEIMQLLHPDDQPLTLEELGGMVGEPIYIVDFEHPRNSGWEICEEIHTDVWCNCDNVAAYGKTWLAYRRKPEEAR